MPSSSYIFFPKNACGKSCGPPAGAAQKEAVGSRMDDAYLAALRADVCPPPGPNPPLVGQSWALEELASLLEEALALLRGAGIAVDSYPVDHVCFRSASADEYSDASRNAERSGARCLVESMIGGRPISTYELEEPIVIGHRSIRLLELSVGRRPLFLYSLAVI